MHQSHARLPTAITIFGGTGDLAKTKLLPALLNLFATDQLPQHFTIIGLARQDMDDEAYQNFVAECLAVEESPHDIELIHRFCEQVRYVSGDFTDDQVYEAVTQTLQANDAAVGQCTNKLFYLAVPPQFYETIFDRLAANHVMELCDGVDSWARLLVEKPFGRDLETARALERKLCTAFKEEQIFRIDHYLAKDAVENILALRFMNTVLADVWDNRSIESMHIKLLETRDVSGRGSLYDTLGTLRDVGQNHLLQIVALLTMARPEAFTSDAIRARRAEALAGLCSHTVNALCRGQYEGYRELDAVHEASDTETYFSLDFTLQAGQWAGTQCTLEAGKALHTKVNEAVITFRPQPRLRDVSGDAPEVCQNVLRIQFAPEQRISLTVWTRTAELTFGLQQQDLTLVDATGEDCASAEAYERVLHDCITGDQTRFVSGDEVDLAWQFITPILEQLAAEPLQTYEAGSAGPQSDVEANQ